MQSSNIPWTEHTFNPWEGCTKYGPGCDDCYAWVRDVRFHRGIHWGKGAERRIHSDAYWRQPLPWNAEARERGRPIKVFCGSLCDIFDPEVEQKHRYRLFALIKITPNLTWQLLTKRIQLAAEMLPDDWGQGYPNVWLMATVVTQREVDRDIPKLLSIPAAKHGISVEPQLEKVSIAAYLPALDWVICGGESGTKSKVRFFDFDWARALCDQCQQAGIAFFMKQTGTLIAGRGQGEDMALFPPDLRIRQFPPVTTD